MPYDSMSDARPRLARYAGLYSQRRPHRSLGGRTPDVATSIHSVCTSIPTNAVLDFLMASLLERLLMPSCSRGGSAWSTHANHDTPQAGRPNAPGHSVPSCKVNARNN